MDAAQNGDGTSPGACPDYFSLPGLFYLLSALLCIFTIYFINQL